MYAFQPMTYVAEWLYAAPEIKNGVKMNKADCSNLEDKLAVRYNGQVDSWSLGLVILELCLGVIPLSAQDHRHHLKTEISQVESQDIKFILSHLLVEDRGSRLFLHEILPLANIGNAHLNKFVHYNRQDN